MTWNSNKIEVNHILGHSDGNSTKYFFQLKGPDAKLRYCASIPLLSKTNLFLIQLDLMVLHAYLHTIYHLLVFHIMGFFSMNLLIFILTIP